ncbi:MAG: hypothetical protein E7368_01180 [Clostridiales bacterium]|nr:hypothetical protein [Clostridiales bacterium]
MTQAKEMKNTPLRRVKYLSLMQMGEQLRAKKTRDKKKKAFHIFLKCCITVVVTAVIIFLLSFIKKQFFLLPTKDMFVSFIFVTQIITLFSCMSSMISILYTSKENAMLLAFPCTYGEIFLSRIIVFAIEELKKSMYFLVPILIAFGVQVGGVSYWLTLLPMWFMLCLFPVLIGALLSIPLIYVKRFLEKHIGLYAFLVIAFIVGLFVGVTILLDKLPDPLRLVVIYHDFMQNLQGAFAAMRSWSLWYAFIGAAMYGEGVYWTLPVSILIFAAFGAACFLIARPFYFKAVSSTVEAGRTKRHKHRKHKVNNLFLTFFRKELKLFVRNSQSVNSAVITILMFPLISYVFNFILLVINKNMLGDFMSIAFNVMITLSVLSANNATAAAAISSEGNEFAVLKTAPSNTAVICWAKIAVTSLVNLFALAVTFVMLTFTTNLGTGDLILMAVLLILLTMGHIMWSFQLDINNPRILDYATKGNNVVDNVNVGKSIVIGFIIATLIGALTLLFMMDSTKASGWIRLLAIAVAFIAARFYLLRRNIKVYFNEIQM